MVAGEGRGRVGGGGGTMSYIYICKRDYDNWLRTGAVARSEVGEDRREGG